MDKEKGLRHVGEHNPSHAFLQQSDTSVMFVTALNS